MAIVTLTRMNFTSYLKKSIDSMGFDGMLASALMGGKDRMKEAIGNLPDEQTVYVDTRYVMAATAPVHLKEVDKTVFQVTLAYPLKDGQHVINVKGDEYEDFIRVWRGERGCLLPGVYKVGFGEDGKDPGNRMRAEVSEDGLTVTVKEAKEA